MVAIHNKQLLLFIIIYYLPLPLTEQLILRYIAFKAPTVGSRSFNVYLAAIRALHICNYLLSPLVTP